VEIKLEVRGEAFRNQRGSGHVVRLQKARPQPTPDTANRLTDFSQAQMRSAGAWHFHGTTMRTPSQPSRTATRLPAGSTRQLAWPSGRPQSAAGCHPPAERQSRKRTALRAGRISVAGSRPIANRPQVLATCPAEQQSRKQAIVGPGDCHASAAGGFNNPPQVGNCPTTSSRHPLLCRAPADEFQR
jgi:hypothetical protein